MTAFSVYLNAIETALAHRQATEHTYRPALNTLIDSLAPGVSATNEPRHVECGAPDFLVAKTGGQGLQVIGYIETKEVGASLDQEERKEQMKRYLGALRNLILTDYLEFRWYVDGSLRRSASLGRLAAAGKFIKNKDGSGAVQELLTDFISHAPQPITTPHELAQRMARLAHLIRDAVVQSFQTGGASSLLNGWREAFARTLIAGLDQPERVGEFADMFSQTLAYGLFSARIMDLCPGFTLAEAQRLIPKTNPFLRRFFYEITGLDLEDEPFYGYVNDLVDLLEHTDMPAVLADFGKRTRKDDPVVHFYETFLAAYDPKLRELRGVYFTPQPVVDFIVRAVDHLLKTRFNLPQGLADAAPALPVKNAGGASLPRLLILDPAAGTGTFLYTVIDFIRQGFMQAGNAGLWQGYVRAQLLPRLYGFELLMAPYAVAHFKLALQLAALDLPPEQRQAWSYDFAANERLNVFLTNTLEEPHEYGDLPLFMQTLAEETRQANRVKDKLPIMVVLGNPPYSGHSANRAASELVRDYYFVDGKPLGEKNPKWLQDDYVKFLRWGQKRIEQTGSGILAFITNHGYLDNPTFRGMRQSLMQTFDEIYILDLHGNAKKKETAPDGGKDENVFDIQQGVAIGIFVKHPKKNGKPCQISHASLFGTRAVKYDQLFESSLPGMEWQELNPQAPFYLLVPQNVDLWQEYEKGWKINEIFPVNTVGVVTGQDARTIGFSLEEATSRPSRLKV